MRDSSGQARECRPENKEGYTFIIKEKVGRGEDHPLPQSWADPKASSFDLL